MATAFMQQYFSVKERYRDYILFYRLGDFYEMFYDDAITASRELELTLTGRDCGEEERAPMCGVPFHSSETYIGRLIAKGYKVAICEQLEDPASTKGIVKRDVVRVITPGTVIESDLLTDTQNNYLAAICVGKDRIGVSFADISTAQICATSFEDNARVDKLLNELGTYAPKEILINTASASVPMLHDFVKNRLSAMINENEARRFDYSIASEAAAKQFGTDFNLRHGSDTEMVSAVGAILDYIRETQMTDISYINTINVYGQGQYMEMDLNTRRNLELCESMRNKEKRGSLFWVLDRTKTAMGARLLRSYVEHPLLNVNRILERQSAIGELTSSFMMKEEIATLLSGVLDLERLMTKVVYGTANGKDLRAICATISVIPQVRTLLDGATSAELKQICEELDPLEDVRELIDVAIAENPPFSVREGGMIREGYNHDVDYLRSVMTDGKGWVSKIEEREREATGIKNLKIGYNRVFGYYIEVTKSYNHLVPEGYVRKQTLTNGERYITDELKEMEATILGASDKLNSLEYELFVSVRNVVAENLRRIQTSAANLAKLDVYISLADVALKNNYVCPEVDYSDVIDIKDGRHPVVEKFVKDSYFVPNDTYLDTSHNRLMLITGPNMAGKSTYMRQSALIVLMAQIGSFVPAKSAHIGIADKLFTRVGASDDLASGQSTFMLEMNEVSYILANATKRSFIIYDEIGRGTSTYDGMSIARAIAEYTCGKKVGARSMFATHYHELTTLEKEMDGVVNYNIAAKKRGDDIIFLRKIVKGPTDDSYGIEVAKLAGLPNEVIKRAKTVLAEILETGVVKPAGKKPPVEENPTLSMMDMGAFEVAERLKQVDLNTLTPIEAMNFIFELKKLI